MESIIERLFTTQKQLDSAITLLALLSANLHDLGIEMQLESSIGRERPFESEKTPM